MQTLKNKILEPTAVLAQAPKISGYAYTSEVRHDAPVKAYAHAPVVAHAAPVIAHAGKFLSLKSILSIR